MAHVITTFEFAAKVSAPNLSISPQVCSHRRLNRHAEALDALGPQGKEESARISQLRGQVLYRLGRYSESADVYKDLHDEDTDPVELAANRSAALCAAGDPEMAEKVINETGQTVDLTSDLAYNRACAIIERGDWPAALKALNGVHMPSFLCKVSRIVRI